MPQPASRWSTRSTGLEHYPFWHATRAELLRRLGRNDEADAADRRAVELPLNDAQRRFIEG